MVRRRRTAPVLLALVLLLLAAGDGPGASGSAGRQVPESPREYLARALDVMRERSVHRNEIDWTRVRRDAHARAASARTPAETYPVIVAALAELGDHHSSFLTRTEAEITLGATEDAFTGPTGRRLPGSVGCLALPAVIGSPATLDRYVRQGRAAVKDAEREGAACGWILDLRQNGGGNVWPMFAVAAPLLGEGTVGSFVSPDGSRTPWYVKNRRPGLNGEESPWGPADAVGTPDPTVAVLTDGGTASAAEAVLIAFKGRPDTRTFGSATYGVPTSNDGFPLSDGAVISLTTALDADRGGRIYDGAVPPDSEVPTSRPDIGTDRDEPLRAATAWLTARTPCHRG
ncbi:S41 family peptidase [Streptomyces sp. NPDC002138]|uniref:S41 family peptidase n=1 Tax=Streptomyces sp. NPDC002138 TaxID=3154410 RepID=UPI0033266250